MEIGNFPASKPSKGVIAASIGLLVVVWAVNFLAAKIGLRYMPTLTMASFRVVLAGIVMAPTYLLLLRSSAFVEAAAARRRGFTPHDWWVFIYLGFFGVAVNQICFTAGLSFTSVSHSALIVGMGPIYTLILAALFGLEIASWRKALGLGIAFLGIGVLASENGVSAHSSSILGDAITMTGSLGFAMYVVLGKRVAGKYDSLTMTAFNHFAGALLVLPLAIRQYRLTSAASSWPPWQGWAALFYMAIFGSALAYIFYFWLLRHLEATQLSAFTYVLPLLATSLSILFLGERGSWLQLVGGGLALGGVYVIEAGRARTSNPVLP